MSTLSPSTEKTSSPVGPAGMQAASADPSAIMKIKNLQLRAKIIVEGFMSGLHRSPYHGFSVEFTDYRPYTTGDDLRYLDWKLVARADRYYINRFEDETNLRCFLLVDYSQSMKFATDHGPKLEYAKTVAATLAHFLTQQRDAVGLLTFADEVLDVIPPRFRRGQMRRILGSLERATSGTATDVATPLENLAQNFRRRGLVVLISDLLAPLESLSQQLKYLSSRGHEVLVLRILAPEEVTFDFQQSNLFHDLESGREIYIDPILARAGYLEQMESHEQALRELCQQLGAGFHRLTTDQPFADALLEFLQFRQQQGRPIRRGGHTRGAGGKGATT